MKTTLFRTLLIASALLAACGGSNGTNSSDSLSATYPELVATSSRSPAGDIHTVVTRVSDGSDVATLDWSETSRKIVYQPASAPSQVFEGDESMPTPTLDFENGMSVSLASGTIGSPDPEPLVHCAMRNPGTDSCWVCCGTPPLAPCRPCGI